MVRRRELRVLDDEEVFAVAFLRGGCPIIRSRHDNSVVNDGDLVVKEAASSVDPYGYAGVNEGLGLPAGDAQLRLIHGYLDVDASAVSSDESVGDGVARERVNHGADAGVAPVEPVCESVVRPTPGGEVELPSRISRSRLDGHGSRDCHR